MAPMDGADHAPTTPSARSVPAASESITVPKQLGSASGQGLETLPTVNEHAVLIVVANYWSFSTCLWPRVAISTESEQILSVSCSTCSPWLLLTITRFRILARISLRMPRMYSLPVTLL